MPNKKKKFIDKKNAVTFHLVHRSQRDPLQADEEAPNRVLLPNTKNDIDSKKEEQAKYGVFFSDDYDYMQHLRDVNELSQVGPTESFRVERKLTKKEKEPQIMLPSTVFASESETDVGLLNKAVPLTGPQLDWDPDIVAGLDEDFNFEDPDNQLEDDFISKAMCDEGELEEHKISDQDIGVEENSRVRFADIASDEADMSSDFDSFDEDNMFEEEETKSRFTNYSMTSSVIRRNEGLTLVDDRFEKLYEQYNEEEIGALDHEEITGFIDPSSQLLSSAMEEFEAQQKQTKLKDAVQPGDAINEESESENEDDLIKMVVEEPKEKWDCESILSTYSTLYNHPKLIEEPRKPNQIHLTKRMGIPSNVLPERGPTRKQIEELNDVTEKMPTYRPKDESAEEKRARKKSVKDERRARREEKKANQLAFKDEKKRQVKELVNLQQAMSGVSIQ